MPEWLITLLTKEDGATKIVKRLIDGNLREVEICPNMVPGIISTLKPLISSDKSVQYAYLCHFSVKHVSKLKKEGKISTCNIALWQNHAGGFCGYRNIQMMTSYIISAKSQGYEVFKNKVPSIFDIQDYIESAWDMGFNSYGRIETNGIRGTRKYIGTPEVCLNSSIHLIWFTNFFQGSCDVLWLGNSASAISTVSNVQANLQRCDVQAIVSSRAEKKPAYETLFGTIEEYFRMYPVDSESKVRSTYLPPIYLQHSGISWFYLSLIFSREIWLIRPFNDHRWLWKKKRREPKSYCFRPKIIQFIKNPRKYRPNFKERYFFTQST